MRKHAWRYPARLSESLVLVAICCSTSNSLGAADPPKDLSARQARRAPEWVTRGVMYQIWLRSFTPEGTLASATTRLPAVAELGANIVYLSPICFQDADTRREFWSERQKASGTNNPRNPYRIADYHRVDPEYGTEADLRTFVNAAHQHGLRVLLDLVYFHCGPTAVLLEHPDWIQRDASGKIVTGRWHFPVLNFENRQLREYLWANMRYWIKDFDVDGFRCDVADVIPLDFWEEARTRLEALRPDLVILAEGERAADQLHAFDLDYGSTWYQTIVKTLTQGQPASSLRTVWEQQRSQRPQGSRFIRFTENHDIVNDMNRAEIRFGKRGAAAATVLNFAIDGVPFVYNGQEIGDTNVQSIFARWPIRWEAACLPQAKATYTLYHRLCQLRRNEAALYSGELVWLENDRPDAVVSFLRHTKTEQIICVIHLGCGRLTTVVALPVDAAHEFTPMLSAAARPTTTKGKLAIAMDGFGYLLAKKAPGAQHTP